MFDRVATRPFDHFVDVDAVRPGRVEPENPGAQFWCHLRIAVLLLERIGDLELRKDWIWPWGEPYQIGVGALQNIVLADVFEQLADQVRGGIRIAHCIAPGGAEFGIDGGVAADAVLLQRPDKPSLPSPRLAS